MVSKRKLAANRRNAKRSTGPRTAKGKAAVRYNALKHGLLAQEVVITAGDGREDPAEFKALLAALAEDLQPVGVLEELLVERIAVCYWRLRRVVRCEVGEIRKRLDTDTWRQLMALAEGFEFHKRFAVLDEDRDALRDTSLGLKHLSEILDRARSSVEDTGHLSERDVKDVALYFGTAEGGLAQILYAFSSMVQEAAAAPAGEQNGNRPSPEQCRAAMLHCIDAEKQRLAGILAYIEDKERLERDAHLTSLALPPLDVGDKILRYETAIERQLYKAMDELRKRQEALRASPKPAEA